MIVELFGLSGSGKTTLAQSFVAQGVVLVSTSGRIRMYAEAMLFTLRHPVVSAQLFLFIWTHASREYRTLLIANDFFAPIAKYARARRVSQRGKIAVIDQGHFQALLSLFEVVPADAAIRKLIRILPKPDLLLVLDVSKEERDRRVVKRGRPVRASAGEDVYPRLLPFFNEESVPHVVIPGVSGAKLSDIFLRHISYVTAARMPTEKAHGVSIAHMCAEFAKSGAEVSLVVPERQNLISEGVFEFYGVPKNFSVGKIPSPDFVGRGYTNQSFFFLQRILFLLKLRRIAFPPGIIYTREPEIAWLFSHSHRAVFEAHRWPRGLAGRLQAFLVRHTALVVCNSRGTAEAAKRYGVQRTLVAPNGFDPALFETNKKVSRIKLGFSDGMLALYAGSDNPGKGADIVRAAAKTLEPKVVSIGIIGTGKKQFSPPLYELGRVSPADVPAYLMSADMLILPTTRENEESERFTSPIKLFEYLAAGKPIIASDVSSVREILSDGDALFIPSGDSAALATAIQVLAKNKLCRARLALRAKELSIPYTWGARTKRILEALHI